MHVLKHLNTRMNTIIYMHVCIYFACKQNILLCIRSRLSFYFKNFARVNYLREITIAESLRC